MSFDPQWVASSSLQRLWVPAVSVQTSTTDVATITVPAALYAGAGYLPVRFFAYGASVSMTLATVSLFTGAGGTGSAVVVAQALLSLTTSSVMASLTVALPNGILSSGSLFVRTITGQGTAATCKFCIELLSCN